MATALFTRWFQHQVFAPESRLHRGGSEGAPPSTQRLLVEYLHLRRRLSPYEAATQATRVFEPSGGRVGWSPPSDYTAFARSAGHLPPYRFGPSLWGQSAPVKGEDMRLCLPTTSAWVDFWSGMSYSAGQAVQIPTPLESSPLFARAGSLVPLAVERPEGEPRTIELRVYPGADARLNLLVPGAPDQPGSSEVVPMFWNDRKRELHLGPRQGGAPLLAAPVKLIVVRVVPGRGTGLSTPIRPDALHTYTGAEARLVLPEPPARPLPPKGLRFHVADGRLNFEWHEVGPGVIYRLKRLASGGTLEDVASALATTRHRGTPPAAGESAQYVVTAANAGGESAPSSVLTVVGETAAPNPSRPILVGPFVASPARPGAGRLLSWPRTNPASSPAKPKPRTSVQPDGLLVA